MDNELNDDEEVKTVLFVELEDTMFNEGTMKKDYEDDNFKIGGDDDKENVGDDNRQVETFIFPDDREDVGGNDQVKTAALLDELEDDEYGNDEYGRYWMKKHRFKKDRSPHNIVVWEYEENIMNWSGLATYWMKEIRFKKGLSQQNKVIWERAMKNLAINEDEFDQDENYDQTKTGGEY